MSLHPSLGSSGKGKRHRSVLKKHERMKILKEKEKWNEEDSPFGLPKVKSIKLKIKKEKAAQEEGAALGTEAAAGETAPEAEEKKGAKKKEGEKRP